MSEEVNRGDETGSVGTTNPGFDPLGAGDPDPHNHSNGGSQLTDWKKVAHDSMEEFLLNCPGTHGEHSQPLSSTELAAGQEDPSVNVCCYKWYSLARNIHILVTVSHEAVDILSVKTPPFLRGPITVVDTPLLLPLGVRGHK